MKKTLILSLSLLISASAYAMEVTPPSKSSVVGGVQEQPQTDFQKLIALQKEQNELLKINAAASLASFSFMQNWLPEEAQETRIIRGKALQYLKKNTQFLDE